MNGRVLKNETEIQSLIKEAQLNQETEWVVITGAPSSGKTALIDKLKEMGFVTNPDITRVHIENKIKNGETKHSVRENEAKLQSDVFLEMVENAFSLDKEKLIFLEYFLPCNIPFLQINHLPIADIVERSSHVFKLKMVFILEPLPFMTDNVKTENATFQKEIDKLLFEYYSELGYIVHRVPRDTIENRVKLILKELCLTN